MPRDVVALVSADDFVSAIRVYADRVNDLLRRRGIPPLEAIEIAETHALALLDAVVNAPETVVDLAGWWFARTLEVTGGTAETTGAETEQTTSMLAGTEGEARVREALAGLSDPQRDALALRDAYDLPPQAVAVALRRGEASTAELAAAARLALVAAYDGRPPPDLSGHTGRTTVDVVSLSRLADDSLDPPRAAPLRRHLASCLACEEMVEALSRGRRLAAGLPIIAMDDDAREAVIERVSASAAAVLPSHDDVLRAVEEDHDPGPSISPVVIVIALLLAIGVGTGVGLLSRSHSPGPLASAPAPTLPPVFPSFSVSASPPPPRHASGHPTVSPTDTVATTSAPPRKTPTETPPTSEPPPATHPQITLSPPAGKSGTDITVSGTGWVPGGNVTVSYAGTPQAGAQVNDEGEFTAHVVANAILPGARRVTVTEGEHSVTTTFNQQF